MGIDAVQELGFRPFFCQRFRFVSIILTISYEILVLVIVYINM